MLQTQRFQLIIAVALLFLFNISTGARETYHLILVPNPTPTTVLRMAELGLPLDDSKIVEGMGLEIPLSASEITLLEENGISYRIIQENLEKYYGDICRKNLENIPSQIDEDPVHMKYGSMGGFYTFQEIVADLDSMFLLYPEICTQKTILGAGWNENPIYMVKISDNPGVNEDEPEGIFDALHHAREPGAYTALIYAMWNLLENYGIDPEVTYLVDNRELYFVPVVNPDGLLYNQQTSPGGGGMWRKNRRDNGGGVYGVDLNRNYTYQWGYDNIGSSPTPSSETYRGPSAGSEPETQAMMNFINEHDMTTGMTIHTASDVYLCAYGYDDVLPEHYDVHMDYMAFAAALNGYDYGTCYQIMYASNGRTQDWQLHTHDIINVEPEIGGDGFWPPVAQIFPEARENQDCFINQFWCAGGQVLFSSIRVEDGYLTPGETEEMIVAVFNRGWGTSEDIIVGLSSTDPYVSFTSSSSTISAILKREYASNSSNPFIVQIDAGCPIGHQVAFTVTIDQGGYLRIEEITLTVGTPTILFEDDMESGIGSWTHGAVTPGWTDQWHLSTLNSHSPTHSWKFGDAGGGDYANHADGGLVSSTINLGISNELRFWHWYEAEASSAYPDSAYDGGAIEISVGGGPWTGLPCPGYTHFIRAQAGGGNPYTGPFAPGTPVFSGSSGGWLEEIVDISAYTGNVQLRFRFGSDNGGADVGWYIDDVVVTGFPSGATPDLDVELTYVSGSPVPPGGGNIIYDLYVVNNDVIPLNWDGWISVEYQGGPPQLLLMRSFTNYLPGWAVNRPNTYYPVPSGWPGGTYYFVGRVGAYPDEIWDESGFSFTKSGDIDSDFDFLSNLPTSGFPNPFDEVIMNQSDAAVLSEMAVLNAYPNPFNPTTALSYKLQAASFVNLAVYDISGRKVVELINGWRDAGTHEVIFDGSRLASGIYLAKLVAEVSDSENPTYTAVQKLVLMK